MITNGGPQRAFTNGTANGAANGNGTDFGAEMLERWRTGGLSERLMDRGPVWTDLYPPIEEEVVLEEEQPVPWLLYGGIALGVILVGRALLT